MFVVAGAPVNVSFTQVLGQMDGWMDLPDKMEKANVALHKNAC